MIAWPALALLLLAAAPAPSLEPLLLEAGRIETLRLAAGDERILRAPASCERRPCAVEAIQDGVDLVFEIAVFEISAHETARFDLPNGRQGPEWTCLPPGGREVSLRATSGSGRALVRLLEPNGERRRALESSCVGAGAYAAQDFATARRAFTDAVAAWDAAGAPEEAAWLATHLAFVLRRGADADPTLDPDLSTDPLEAFRRARERWRALGGHGRQEARALSEIGHLLHRRGEHGKAVLELRAAVGAATSAGDAGDAEVAARAKNNLGLALHALGRAAEARDAYAGAAEAFEAAGDARRQATALSNLAAALQDLGDSAEALVLHRRALGLFRQLDDPAGVARVASNRAVLLRRLGRFQEALDAYDEALELQRRHGVTAAEASTLGNLGELHLLLGELGEARRLLERALELHRQVGDSRGEANTLHNLGTAARQGGGAVAASGLYRRAARLHAERGDERSAAVSLSSLGVALALQGRFDDARQALEEAAEKARRLDDPATAALAWLRLVELDLEGAGATGPAELTRTADRLAAAEKSARRAGAATTLAAVHVAGARLARRGGDLEAASRLAHAAAWDVEALRRQVDDPELRATFLAARRDAYEVAVAVEALRHGRGEAGALERAWLLGERARARALLDLLALAGEAPSERARPIDAEGARRLLDPGTVLLAYLLGERESHLLVLGDGPELRHHPLPPRREVESAALALRRAFSTLEPGAEGADRQLASELSRLLLGPATESLSEAGRLVVVADGALHGLPFAALPWPGDEDAEVIDRLEVVHLPSASVLARLRGRTRQAGDGSAVVLADPALAADSPWTRLPFSRLEAEAVARLAGPATRTLVGESATLGSLETPEVAAARLLHVASHAVIDAERPERSGLVLSGGVAALESLRGLELSADLVVLSGCSTALGKPLLGEGFVGLVHGFFDAGASRVVASLWPVDDRSTAELMERFYAAYLGDGLPASAALRRAQRDLRRDRRHSDPWHWAPFVLVGDWRP